MGFPRQEYWSGLLFPSPGDLPDPGIKPTSPALQQILYRWGTGEAPHLTCCCCCCCVTSVVSDSVWPHPWDSPGKNTGVGWHFLLRMHKSEKWKLSRSAMSDSSQPHGLQPTRLLRPWDFPGKSTGVGCHCLLCSSYLQPLKGSHTNHRILFLGIIIYVTYNCRKQLSYVLNQKLSI